MPSVATSISLRSRVKFPRRNGGNVAVFPATKGVRCACEQFRGSAHIKLLSNYVIVRKRSDVAIPRKGSFRLRLCLMMTNVAVIKSFSTSALGVIPPQRRYPDHPPLIVKGTLLVVTSIGRLREIAHTCKCLLFPSLGRRVG